MKRKMTKILTAALCVMLLVAALAVYAAADDTVQPTVVYLDGTNGADTNDGSAANKAVATLGKAYEVLLAVDGGVKNNADAEGIIVVCGTTKQSDNFANTTATALEHKGTVTYTSNYGGVDYAVTNSAKMTFATSGTAELRIQMGGPTVYSKVTISASGTTKSVTIYTSTSLKVEQDATIEATLGTDKFFIRGGHAYRTTAEDISIVLNTGTYSFVAPTNAEAASTGSFQVTVGGDALVNRLIGGETNSAGGTNASTVLTVNAGATVNELYVVGDTGTVTDATVIINGGTVDKLSSRRSGKTGMGYNVTLVLKGDAAVPANAIAALGSNKFPGTKTLEISESTNSAVSLDTVWNTVKVTGSSNITMAAAIPENTALIVESGSKVTLAEGDAHTYTGDGEVVYVHEHSWVEDTANGTAGSCTVSGTAAYLCDIGSCTATKTEQTGFVHNFVDGVCIGCNGSNDKVYVRDGGTGDGYTASTAVGSLEDAYAALLDRTDIGTNAQTGGTIVICGQLTLNEHFNYYGGIAHAGTVTYTGEGYNGVLQICAASKSDLTPNDEHRIQLAGPTVMEYLTIDRGSAYTAVSMTIYTSTSLVMAETVEIINTNWAGTYVEPIVGLTDEQIASMKLSAHRGFQPMGPENSILSFTAAGELGFDYIECDVYQTSDGQLITIHDSTLDRTTNGSGNVMNMTYEQILQYRIDTAGYGFDITTANSDDLYVPTFREYLEICKQYGCIPFIEIKDYREDTIHKIIDMALEYFEPQDIVMSCISLSPLETSYAYNKDVFHHLIWGDQSDSGYTNSIKVLSQMKNSDGDVYAGIAFNITNLHVQSNFDKAKSWIEKANAAGLQTCLRGADDMTQVRKMFELGIDYYPTNTTNPEKLQQLKESTEGGYGFTAASGGKVFIRGGSRNGETAGDISITLLGGIYDFVAPSNAEAISTGNYSVTVGGNAFVSRLIAGETASAGTGDRESSVVTVQDEAIVNNLYLAGDTANTKSVTVNILGGTVKAMSENRGKPGMAENVTVNIASVDLLPGTVSISSSLLTGTKVLSIGGTGELGNAAAWDKLVANDGAVITLTGAYPEDLERVGFGKFLVHDQSVTFTEADSILEDGAAVELGDISCSIVGSGAVTVNWYADSDGEKGEALNTAPVTAGTYWIGVSIAEAQDANEALYHAAVAEQTVRFTIVHDLKLVPRVEPQVGIYGNIEHYQCNVCGMRFDAEGNVLTEREVVLDPLPEPSIPETSTEPETTEPETTEPETTEPETTEPETTEPETTVPETTVPGETKPEDGSPGTGDASAISVAAAMLLCAAAVVTTVGGKKKFF